MQRKLKKQALVILVLVFLVAIFFEFFLVKNLIKQIEPVDTKTDNILFKYNETSAYDYKVILVDNEFIPEEFQNMGESYILDFVNFITFSHNYTYKATELSNIIGKYYVEAKLLAYHRVSADKSENPKIWEKKFEIKTQDLNHPNTKEFTDYIAFNLELDEYQKAFEEFKETLKDVMVEGYLELNIITEYEGKKDEFVFEESYTDKFTIPLSTQIFSITHSPDSNEENVIYKSDIQPTSPILIAVNIGLVVIVFIGILLIVKILFFRSNKTPYQKDIDEILKNYDEIIVSAKSYVSEDKYEVFEITEFKELYELSRELNLPIMHYEFPNKTITFFYILKDNLLYVVRFYEDSKYRFL